MKLPELKIGNLISRLPIIQGGMGVGISLSSLAGAVAGCGGIGVISGVEIGFNEANYRRNKREANKIALKRHIRQAKEMYKEGVLGINLMVALNNFEEMVIEAVKEKIDIIFSGAGLPLTLPKFVKESLTKIVPIISSSRAAQIICKSWDMHYHRIPDAIVIEGPLAGGHLGFLEGDLNKPSNDLNNILKEVITVIKPYEVEYKKNIPIIAGGGVYSGKDIAELLKNGASGIQMATRFVATYECDASKEFKNAYVKAKLDDIEIIKSPVGMIGRAIKNDFLNEMNIGNKRPIHCNYNCLRPCDPTKAPYCIAEALINAQKGNMKDGFAFAGANVHRINKIVSVKELINELVTETKENL